MTAPTYAVKVPDGRIVADLSWTNASEQVRLYGAEWVHDYEAVLAKAQDDAKKNSNTSGNVRKLTPVEEARVNAPDFLAAAAKAASEVAESGSSDLADMTREELFEIAATMKLSIDKRTGHAKLVETIQKARSEVAAAVVETPAPEASTEKTPAETEE
jgi:hypothetical protein